MSGPAYEVDYEVDRRAVRRARLKKHMTQEQLAEASGISHPTISRIENGTRKRPHFSTLKKLARVLDREVDDLIIHHN